MYRSLHWLLLATTLIFLNNRILNYPSEPNKKEPLTFHTIIPPAVTYASLKLLNKKKKFALPAEKIVIEEIGAIGLTQAGLSKPTAEKITRCSIAIVNDKEFPSSPQHHLESAGKVLLSEIIIDEIEDSYFPPNTEDNTALQTGKLIAKGLARHYLDNQFDDMSDWYPAPPPFLQFDNKFYSSDEINPEDFDKQLLTLLINCSTKTFIAKKLREIIGQHTYLSIKQLPVITADDIAAATVTGVTCHYFEQNSPKKTSKKIGKEFVVRKMVATELGIIKRCWHYGVNNLNVLKSIDKWHKNHPKITWVQKNLAEYTLTAYTNKFLEELYSKSKN